MAIKKNDRVQVYQDPITRQKPEEIGTVQHVITAYGWNAENGSPVYRVTVKFADRDVVTRDVALCDVLAA